jgi:tricorn protease
MLKKLAILALLFLGTQNVWAQTQKPIFRYPHVSDKDIVFGFANDLWIVSKKGGLAQKLSSPAGAENWARFSPDGSAIAFSGNYNSGSNIFTISPDGGIPKQVTWLSMAERVVGWYPDGKHILFTSSMHSGKQRFSQFFKVSAEGGIPEKLPIAHAEFGALSPDGKKIAFTDKTRAFRTWKRYRGGTAPDIIVFDLETYESERITNTEANDEFPMWIGNHIYYLSDLGDDMRYNLWKYHLPSKKHIQVTFFKDKDVHFPAAGRNEIVFEAGGDIYLLNASNDVYERVDIRVLADFSPLRPRKQDASEFIGHYELSPDGSRVVMAARGDIFNLPVKNGFTQNLSQSSGSAERFPSWSPDGSKIACWSDSKGEYNLLVYDLKTGTSSTLTNFKDGYRYKLYWSPDSKHLAWIDQTMQVQVLSLAGNKLQNVSKQKQYMHYALQNFSANWSADSRWLAFSQQLDNGLNGIQVFNVESGKGQLISGGLYSLTDAAFDPEGKYLYVTVSNHFEPTYSAFDNSFIYANSRKPGLFTLRPDVKSPLYPENDTVAINIKGESEPEKKKEEKKKEDKDEGIKKDQPSRLEIDFQGIEARLVMLPIPPGNYGKIHAIEGKLIYSRLPNSGHSDGKSAIRFFDMKEKEEKLIIEGYGSFNLSANGKKLLIARGKSLSVIDIAPDQKADKTIDLSGLRMDVNPKEEYQQLFNDAWRIQRDFFYDKAMHQLDWAKVKQQYQPLMDRATTRGDVNYVIGELIGELNASHAYRSGGDYQEEVKDDPSGYLGINWGKKNGHFFIEKIIRAADWDTEVRSPLLEPGLQVKEGEYIISVNGTLLSNFSDPQEAFSGMAGKVAELEINDKPGKEGSRKVLVKLLSDETRLRNLAWIEANRQYVDKASGGRIGYVYVPSTGLDGQMELVRMFYGQYRKEALIIDERFNNGGQIPDRFIELLNRKPLAFWKTRDGADWQWPPVAHFGPKAMLINGWSGSGGDAFPDYFRKSDLGPLIGTRTWGGLIGISGAPELIDGGSVSAPTFRMFHPDGSWFPEGYGVDPDEEVLEDYTALAKGRDAQLDKAIDYLIKQLRSQPFQKPEAPGVEKRN